MQTNRAYSRIAVFAAFLTCFLQFAGCDRQESVVAPSKATTNEVNRVAVVKRAKKPIAVIDALAPTAVVVRVNGENITKADFIGWEQARVKTWAISKGWKPNIVNEDTEKYLKQSRARVLGELVKHKLIEQFARENGIVPDEKDVTHQERKFLRQVKRPKAKFADVVSSLGKEEGAALRRVVRGDALTLAVLEHTTSNNLRKVSAEEFTNRVEFVKQWNARTDETNAVTFERAKKAKEEILAGAYFADVAKKYADFCPEQGVKWDTIYLDDLDGDNPLGHWLAQADTGDISDPLDLDDGLCIVGLKMKYESALSESNKPPVYAYEVVRCPFYVYEKLDDFDGDRKAIEEDMIETRRHHAMNELRESLFKTAKIEFPSGNNLFYPREHAKKKVKAKDKAKGKVGKKANKPPKEALEEPNGRNGKEENK